MVRGIKKFNIIKLVIASLFFTSCNITDNEIERYDKISFTCDSIETRASGFNQTGSNPLLSLGVYAAATPTNWDINASLNLMSEVEVKRPDATSPWAYTDDKYWPGSGVVSFFSYAPYTANGLSVSGTAGVPQITLTTPNVHTNQADLLVAAPLKNQTRTSATDGRVNFQMKHALTRISFASKLMQAQTEQVRITKISLSKLYNKGVCSMDAANLNWSVTPTVNTTPQILDFANSGIKNQVLTTTYESITPDNGYLFYIPQTINSDAEVEITYSLNNVIQTETIKFKLVDVLSQWQAGEAIRFLIDLDLNKPFNVKLGYSFEPWGNSSIDVPIDANPYLYVSDVKVKTYDASVTRVYFYSNQPKANVYIDQDALETSINGTTVKVKDKFMDIVDGDVQGAKNFVYEYDETTKSGKGYVDFINVIDQYVRSEGNTTIVVKPSGDQPPILVRLRAGKLDYYINVTQHITPYIASSSSNVVNPPFSWMQYTASFHRKNEVGERVITFYLHNTLPWTASIDQAGDGADLVIDRIPSPDYAANLLYGPTPRDAEGAVVSDWTTNIGPNGARAISGRGRVYFRVGWKKTTTTNKYAIIKIEYTTDTGIKDLYIYCRQGEDPDYIVNATDDKFSPYNLVGDGVLGKYPSQGGFISQWGRPRQWPLTGLDSPTGYPTTIESELDKDVAICPEGYTYPDQTTVNTYRSNSLAFRAGFCADGYFDRRYEEGQRVNRGLIDNASVGGIYYKQGEVRSLFFPTPGFRTNLGRLNAPDIGPSAYYWTSVADGQNNALSFFIRSAGGGGYTIGQSIDKRISALVKCIKVTDPGILKFDANGGENASRSSTVMKNASSAYIAYISKKIPNSYWRPGYLFYSWKTDKDGTGADIFSGTDYTMASKNVTLYANWSKYYRVDFTKLLNTTLQTQYITSSSYYNVSGNFIAKGIFSGSAGIDEVALVEKAYQKIEFHETIQTANNWSDASNFCKTLVDTNRPTSTWRLPRLLELMLVSQLTPVTSWGQSELFGGDSQPLWSGTQKDASNAYQSIFYNSNATAKASTESIKFRCVREF